MRQDDKDQLGAMAAFIFIILGTLAMIGAMIIGGQYAVKRLGLHEAPPTCVESK